MSLSEKARVGHGIEKRRELPNTMDLAHHINRIAATSTNCKTAPLQRTRESQTVV